MGEYFLKSLILGALVFGSITLSTAQGAASVTLNASSTLLDRVTIAKGTDVNFGGIFLPEINENFSVVMNHQGAVSQQSGGSPVGFNGTSSAGSIILKGSSGNYHIIFAAIPDVMLSSPETNIKLTYQPHIYKGIDGSEILFGNGGEGGGGGEGDDDDEGGGGGGGGAANGHGLSGSSGFHNYIIKVAGKLIVPASAPSGLYTGNFQVNITWN